MRAIGLQPAQILLTLMSLITSIKNWAHRMKHDVVAIYFAARHPETPLVVRILALLVAAYALSPIDLIPDFIPVLGYLDDLLIVPLGIMIVIQLLPPHILESSRAKAAALLARPRIIAAAIFVIFLWLVAAGLIYQTLIQ